MKPGAFISLISRFISALTIFHLISPAASRFWVSKPDRHSTTLVYRTTSFGDRILDFSPVGYLGEDAPTPGNITPLLTIAPSQAGSIQEAINNISSLPIQASGFRGAILLTSGIFNVPGQHFTINSTGVVIRGSTETILHTNFTDDTALFTVESPGEKIEEVGLRASVVSDIPSGSDHIVVNSTLGLKSGDLLLLHWTQTQKWIEMMNMTDRWGNVSETSIERLVTKVDHQNRKVFLDAQVPFRIELSFLNPQQPAYLVKIRVSGRVQNIGLENFKVVQDAVLPNGGGTFLNMMNVQDSWVKNVVAVDFGGDIVTVGGKRITIDNLRIVRNASPPKGAKPADLAINFPGSQILVKNSVVEGGGTDFNFMTRNEANGPNVFFNCTGQGTAHAEPHAHFATGILYDNVNLASGGSLDLARRNFAHHGYTSAFSVAWNCKVAVLNVINPPQAANWAIGCAAGSVGVVTNEHPGFVEPHGIQSPALSSLFLAQKAARYSSLAFPARSVTYIETLKL